MINVTQDVSNDELIIGGKKFEFTPELLEVKIEYDKLTELQRKWLNNYLVTRDGNMSAKKAGYSGDKNSLAHVGTYNKNKCQHIIDILDAHAGEAIKAVTDLTELYRFWGETIGDTKHSMTNRLKASELLGRAIGAFDRENGTVNFNFVSEKFDEIPQETLEKFIIEATTAHDKD